jgi:hypothetical protein
MKLAKEFANQSIVRTFGHDLNTIAGGQDDHFPHVLAAHKSGQGRSQNLVIEGEPFPNFNGRCLVADSYDCELHYLLVKCVNSTDSQERHENADETNDV